MRDQLASELWLARERLDQSEFLQFGEEVPHLLELRGVNRSSRHGFVETHYKPGMATSLRQAMAESWTKPHYVQAVEWRARRAFYSPQTRTRPLPLASEIPKESAALAVYWQSLPELPIPDVPVDGDGVIYDVEAVESALVDVGDARAVGIAGGDVVMNKVALPTIRIANRDSLMRYRLPMQFSKYSIDIVSLAHASANPFPCPAEFGKYPIETPLGGYFVHLH
jgi:hypothetical protein